MKINVNSIFFFYFSDIKSDKLDKELKYTEIGEFNQIIEHENFSLF